jgi:hypothetical protein
MIGVFVSFTLSQAGWSSTGGGSRLEDQRDRQRIQRDRPRHRADRRGRHQTLEGAGIVLLLIPLIVAVFDRRNAATMLRRVDAARLSTRQRAHNTVVMPSEACSAMVKALRYAETVRRVRAVVTTSIRKRRSKSGRLGQVGRARDAGASLATLRDGTAARVSLRSRPTGHTTT